MPSALIKFTASLLFKSIHSPALSASPLWEERLVLILAATKEEALTKATTLGQKEQHSYKTVAGDTAHWTFDEVLSVYEINADDLSDSTELFSRFLRDSEVASLKEPFSD